MTDAERVDETLEAYGCLSFLPVWGFSAWTMQEGLFLCFALIGGRCHMVACWGFPLVHRSPVVFRRVIG
jgi:hypothetical protein